MDLGGLTLTSGVYCFAASAQLTGTLKLDAQGDPNAVFVFQIGSTLTTASSPAVVFLNGGQGDSVFWQVGSSATLGTTTALQGNMLTRQFIHLNSGASTYIVRALTTKRSLHLGSNHLPLALSRC